MRRAIVNAKRLVVKVGSSSLTDADGHLDQRALTGLVDVLAERVAAGTQVVLVTSGAVAAGLEPLGFASRPSDLASVQAAASVGQGHLIAAYTSAFATHGLTVAQVLLTADDIVRRHRYENANRTLNRLLELGAVPIINENDAVTVAELKFGDNDRLAALAALIVKADAMVLLTDVDGLHTLPPSDPRSERISTVADLAEVADVTVTTSSSKVGTGGMITKLASVKIAVTSGIPVILAATRNVAAAIAGDDVGTMFAATGRPVKGRIHWLTHAAGVRGQLILDDGAVSALRGGGASLLPVGILSFSGDFDAGDPVELVDFSREIVARGLAGFSSVEMPRLLGRNSRWLRAAFGKAFDRPAVHRDDLALIPSQGG
jgi:glutamate 5-kinase